MSAQVTYSWRPCRERLEDSRGGFIGNCSSICSGRPCAGSLDSQTHFRGTAVYARKRNQVKSQTSVSTRWTCLSFATKITIPTNPGEKSLSRRVETFCGAHVQQLWSDAPKSPKRLYYALELRRSYVRGVSPRYFSCIFLASVNLQHDPWPVR
jgi:hypothetical protein